MIKLTFSRLASSDLTLDVEFACVLFYHRPTPRIVYFSISLMYNLSCAGDLLKLLWLFVIHTYLHTYIHTYKVLISLKYWENFTTWNEIWYDIRKKSGSTILYNKISRFLRSQTWLHLSRDEIFQIQPRFLFTFFMVATPKWSFSGDFVDMFFWFFWNFFYRSWI